MVTQTGGTLPRSPASGAQPVGTAYSLAVYFDGSADVVPLDAGQAVVVGRAAPSDVVVRDRSLSQQHARFSLRDGTIKVEDLGSTNGIVVGGARVDSAELQAGIAVEIGDTRCLVHVRGALATNIGTVATHEHLMEQLARQVAEARHFRDNVALLMLHVEDQRPMSDWHAHTLAALRSVDVVGMYAGSIMEVVLPRCDETGALERAAALSLALMEQGQRATCAIAVFPDAGTSAEVLLQRCRHSLESAGGTPVVATAAERGDLDDELTAASPAMRLCVAQLERIAKTNLPVLLMGETGTGKELLAEAIHRRSARANGPLVPLNCGAIAPQLVESTLFGHEKGAFTGAAQANLGVFRAADGGTVLLDEIGELPLAVQASLLRVLETGRVTPVGATTEVATDVRVIAATHRDLETMVEAGEFREDLLYRINALPLLVPPLRRRREDIPILAERFLERAGRMVGEHTARGFSQAALTALMQYRWPGNVRELRNIVERACVLTSGELIAAAHIHDRFRRGTVDDEPPPDDDSTDLRESLRQFEAALLRRALRDAKGDRRLAAKCLKIPHRTLNHKLKTLNIA